MKLRVKKLRTPVFAKAALAALVSLPADCLAAQRQMRLLQIPRSALSRRHDVSCARGLLNSIWLNGCESDSSWPSRARERNCSQSSVTLPTYSVKWLG